MTKSNFTLILLLLITSSSFSQKNVESKEQKKMRQQLLVDEYLNACKKVAAEAVKFQKTSRSQNLL